MNRRIRLVFRKNAVHVGAVADVHLLERISWLCGQGIQRAKVGRVSELVDIDDGHPVFENKTTADRRADKARPARYQHTHRLLSVLFENERKIGEYR
jgi:hypothetical protein